MSISFLSKSILVCIFGIVLSLSTPGFDLWFLAWFCLAPLFYSINSSRNMLESIFYAFIFGFFYNIFSLHWLFSLHPLTWLGLSTTESYIVSFLALLITAIYNSLFFIFFAISVNILKIITNNRYNKGVINLILTTFFWVIIFNKLGSSKLLIGFPWTLIEYSQYKNLFLIQIANYLGGSFISFLIVFFNLSLGSLISWRFNVDKIGKRYLTREPGQLGSILNSLSFSIVLISLVLIYGSNELTNIKYKFSKNSKTISIIQGNLPIKATRGKNLNLELSQNTYNDLISNVSADLTIFPEGSIPTIFNDDNLIKEWLLTLAKEKETSIIAGTYCTNGNALTNCAVKVSPENNKIDFYEKERLVPFGEYTPFYSILPSPLKKFLDFAIGKGFKSGKLNSPIKTSIGKIGISICFELIFPTLIREQSLKGAELFVNLSDLSWFSNDIVKKQFIAFGVFRAVENRKPVIIATNNGISVFITPWGRIKEQSISKSQGMLPGWVNPSRETTFYSKYGW